MLKKLLKNTDFILFACMVILVVVGIIAIYSAGYNTDVNKDEYIKQMIWFGVSFILMVLVWLVDYNMFDIVGYILYIINLVMLIVVLFMPTLMGASSWFNFGGFLYQPSELMKIGTILCSAKFLSICKNNISKHDNLKRILLIAISVLTFILPIGLIILQPDFGTAMTFVVIAAFMLFKFGIKYRYIFCILAVILIAIPIVYNFMLNDVQKERINVFLNSELDPLGSGYNAIQSKIAIGSGMLFGTGILKGSQTQNGYIPIKSTDFIFSVICEEMGYVMAVFVIVVYTVLILRLLNIANKTDDTFASLVVVGIAGMFFYHFVENIGMTIGLLPITGVPLPFLSYGGSNMLTNTLAIAIALNISARNKKDTLFM